MASATNPEDIPPRRSLAPRHRRKPLIHRLEHILATQHQLLDPRILLALDRALRQSCRVTRLRIHIRQEPVRQDLVLPLTLLPVKPPIIAEDVFEVLRALLDEPAVDLQELRERRRKVEVVVQPDDVARYFEALGVDELDLESAPQLNAFPWEEASLLDTQDGGVVVDRSGRRVVPSSAEKRRYSSDPLVGSC